MIGQRWELTEVTLTSFLLLSELHDTYSKFWQITYSMKRSSDKPNNSGQLCWTAIILCSYVVPLLCHFISAKSNRYKISVFEWNGNLTPDLHAALCYPKILIQFLCSDQTACPFPNFQHLAIPVWSQILHWYFINCHRQLLIFQDISHVLISTSLFHTLLPAVTQDEYHPV